MPHCEASYNALEWGSMNVVEEKQELLTEILLYLILLSDSPSFACKLKPYRPERPALPLGLATVP